MRSARFQGSSRRRSVQARVPQAADAVPERLQIDAGQLDVQPRRQFAALHRPADLPEAEALPLLLEQLAAAQQRLVLVAAFALEVEDLQHPLHRTGLAALAEKAHAGAQEDIQRRHPGVFVGYLDLAEGAVAHRQADLDLVLVVAVDRTARNPGGVRQVGHGSSAHALFQENPLGGIEYAVAGFLGFLFGFPGH